VSSCFCFCLAGLSHKNINQSEKAKITKIYPGPKGSFSDFAFSPFRVGAKKAKIAKTVFMRKPFFVWFQPFTVGFNTYFTSKIQTALFMRRFLPPRQKSIITTITALKIIKQ